MSMSEIVFFICPKGIFQQTHYSGPPLRIPLGRVIAHFYSSIAVNINSNVLTLALLF
jgi:hypothetical protein